MPSFDQLFVGSDLSHGSWDGRRKSPARTEPTAATPEDYGNHLAGKLGLGLVPVRVNGTCRFGAIDIDIDTIDHETLYQQVANLGLPLNVCRSKSGGAHLYVFVDEPGLPASKMKRQLEEWAQRLGYGVDPNSGKGTEVFPKQTKIGPANQGNWINLPYFDAAETTRPCYGPEGPLSLEEFEKQVVVWDGKPRSKKAEEGSSSSTTPSQDGVVEDNLFKILGQGPPCVEKGVNLGIPAGARNSFMFNLSIGTRRASPEGWRDLVRQINEERCSPPLDKVELESIMKSVGRKATYEFQCEEGSISSLCNFQGCLRRPYGKGYKRERDEDNFDQLLLTHLRKINTDPPRYILEVNGQDVELDTDQLLTYSQLRRRLMERLDLVPPPMKQPRWELQLQELLQKRTDIDAPEDASRSGLLLDRVRDFLMRYKRAVSLEDVLKDLPYRKDERVFFRATGLFKFLSQYRLDGDPQTVYALLHSLGGQHSSTRVKGRVTAVWSMPASELREQTEDFTAVEIVPEEEIL